MQIIYTITENGINDKKLPTVDIHISGLNNKDMPTNILMKKINKVYSTVVALSCLNKDDNFSNDQQKDEEVFKQASTPSENCDSSYNNLKVEENKTEVKHKGHILITADSIKELQAKVNYEKEILSNNENQSVVYSAVISTFSVD
ncbi:hypothetical protein [Elizabethkingia anophelis]|uniref:hypothetical protein n=1 Tax=Elizabethkingia anophelis TaxID=1117645 RepID=UPI001625D6F6|nr:hypothetical protein [Elizabethkingia anophelis]